jgi:putative phosphoribosyl transferase
MLFSNRVDAGRRLAAALMHLRDEPVVVLGLPRGGVPVAAEIARALSAPLDVIVVRKLGVPFQPELGMGAIGEGGVRVINQDVVLSAGVREHEIAEVERRESAELERRARQFRGDRPREPLENRVAVVVDDGLATGSTARAACQIARGQGAAKVVLAVPVAPRDWTARLGDAADELVTLATPEPFYAIGQFYDDFSQTTDAEVVRALQEAARTNAAVGAPADSAGRDDDVEVPSGEVRLGGHLTLPDHPIGVVVFAHGSGSSRHSPRNQFVASRLHDAGLGTLLFDLLTPEEEVDRGNVFDIDLLGRRLADASAWLRGQPGLAGLPIGYFGASTGAAAALWAAAQPGIDVAAVVSRGGRPDLAPRLGDVTAPTLLIVGGNDDLVLELNRRAAAQLRCEHVILVVPGASHLFEEPGTLAVAADAARDWFVERLARARRQDASSSREARR